MPVRCLPIAGLALLLAAAAGAAPPLLPRRPPEKPGSTALGLGHDPGRLVLKFAEGSGIQLRGGRFEGRGVARANELLRRAGVGPRALRRYFPLAKDELAALRATGQGRSRRALADLDLYYAVELPARADAGALCDALNALPVVELATPAPAPQPAPADVPPATPSLVSEQGYRASSPSGVGANAAARIPGATGNGIAVADVEYEWVLDHEDLGLLAAAYLDTATGVNPFPDQGNHGSAALGVVGARQNGYGASGLAPAATLLVAPANTAEFGYDPARAIALAATALEPGDVLLVEQQTWVCGGQLGPLEWIPVVFDAIATATAQGIVVVAAAGNGSANLDDAGCGGWFDRNVRDSGSILVGAGDPVSHARLWFSSYGSRVDVQGWGSDVTTLGYGDRFDPGDVHQRYTASFSGTSSASALVAGAVASIQGALHAYGAPALGPFETRALLSGTGTPQSGTQHIGPLPDIAAALAALGISPPTAPHCGLGGLELVPLLGLLGWARARRALSSGPAPGSCR